MKRRVIKFALGILAGMLCLTGICLGQTLNPENLFDMSLEDLMDVPIVVSASRTQQKIGELSVPVSIITAEDIHYSGLTNHP